MGYTRQAIIWTHNGVQATSHPDDGLGYWRPYASLGLYESTLVWGSLFVLLAFSLYTYHNVLVHCRGYNSVTTPQHKPSRVSSLHKDWWYVKISHGISSWGDVVSLPRLPVAITTSCWAPCRVSTIGDIWTIDINHNGNDRLCQIVISWSSTWEINQWMRLERYGEICARSRYLEHGQIITSLRILWDVFTHPCPWYYFWHKTLHKKWHLWHVKLFIDVTAFVFSFDSRYTYLLWQTDPRYWSLYKHLI